MPFSRLTLYGLRPALAALLLVCLATPAFAADTKALLADASRAESWLKGNTPTTHTALLSFLKKYPVWPEHKQLVATFENTLDPQDPPTGLLDIYKDSKPVTLNGFDAYITALRRNGEDARARADVQQRWIEGPVNAGDTDSFYQRYTRVLTDADHRARLDRLVWDNEDDAAQAMARYVDDDTRAEAAARLALQNGKAAATQLLGRLSSRSADSNGVIYARVVYRTQNDDVDGAIAVLKRGDTMAGRPEMWWKARHILIRELLELDRKRDAYALAEDHGITLNATSDNAEKTAFADAEFLAGWLALRFAGRAQVALGHFENLYNNVMTPMSRARGAYWIGRTHEALGDKTAAAKWYTIGAEHYAFYYGQLCMAKLSAQPVLSIPGRPAISSAARSAFTAKPLPAIAGAYAAKGDTPRAEVFLKTAIDNAADETDFYLLADLARKIHSEELQVRAAKAANMKGFILHQIGHPVMKLAKGPARNDIEEALALGIIRQESQFKSDAKSPAGALGLMQMLPSSARSIARHHGYRWRGNAGLYRPDTNVTLGRTYLSDRIEQFGGSYIMAIAAYNGGQGNVRKWQNVYGDPQAGVDPIDWVELIPLGETRNYVQRVMENTQLYRAYLNKLSAPLKIAADLQR